MRISDWSSDVCSSDLRASGSKLCSHTALPPQPPRHRCADQPARRNSQNPANAQTPAGTSTANSGEKQNTRLDGPRQPWAIRKVNPTSTPDNTRSPRDTKRSRPRLKERDEKRGESGKGGEKSGRMG